LKIEVDLRLGRLVDPDNCPMSLEVLDFLTIKSLPLMVNNPEGIRPFRSAGLKF
jgi:hypothetical protein